LKERINGSDNVIQANRKKVTPNSEKDLISPTIDNEENQESARINLNEMRVQR
jgi:hypothetical protein